MSEYYAVQRSDEYLAHYGVKGMKWGVRKAIADGNGRRLERHYKKAAKKLAKLDEKTNIKKQNEKAAKYNKIAKRSATVGAAGLGAAGGATGVLSFLKKRANKAYNEFYYPGWDRDAIKAHEAIKASGGKNTEDFMNWARNRGAQAYKMEQANSHLMNIGNPMHDVRRVGAAMGAVGLGVAAASKAKSIAAKRRTTAKGHTKAVAKRNAWKKEMQSAFKGTKYQNLPEVKKPINTKKLNRQLKRANNWADAYRDSIAELKRQNNHTDIYKKRNDKYIAKWNKKLNKHESRARNIRKQLET